MHYALSFVRERSFSSRVIQAEHHRPQLLRSLALSVYNRVENISSYVIGTRVYPRYSTLILQTASFAHSLAIT